MTTKCPKTVDGGEQCHAPCEILSLHLSLFLRQLNLWKSYDSHKVEVSLANLSFGDITGFEIVLPVIYIYICVYVRVCLSTPMCV